MNPLETFATRLLLKANNGGKILAVHLTRWTGKSRVRIHPKNLVRPEGSDWYVEHVPPGSVLLDVGCGSGTHSAACAGRAAVIDAFDYSDRNLAVAREVCRGAGNIRLLKMDAQVRWALPDARYDVVLLLDILEHLVERGDVLAECRRVLKPGGRILLSVPNVATSWKRRLKNAGIFHYTDRDHKIEYTEASLREELERAGLQILWGPEPVVLDTPLAGLIDLTGGLSLGLYRRLSRWKRRAALRRPEESIGFRLVAREAGTHD